MLLGHWKNYAELEENLSLDELEALLEAYHEQQHENRKFAAALKGIDIDEGSEDDAKKRFEASQQRAEAVLTGKSVKSIELEDFGIDVE